MTQRRIAVRNLVLGLLILSCYPRFSLIAAAQLQQESFSEEIVVSPLFDGRISAHFQFSFSAPYKRHYTVLPLSVGQLVSAVPFTEVELSLTQGRWHYHRWDHPLTPVKPAGAELRAVFSPQIPNTALPHLWSTISHALGGIFCASLHFVARPESTALQAITAELVTPVTDTSETNKSDTYNNVTNVSNGLWRPGAAREHVLSAALPQEASCTENLTPWLKLLPCRDAAGLAGLLKRRDVIFGAEYHSLRVLLKVQRDKHLNPLHITLTQTLTLVLDPSSSSSSTTPNPRDKQVNSSSSSSSSSDGRLPDINLDDLLGTRLHSSCPVAQTSRVYLLLPGQWPLSDQQLQQQLLPAPLQCSTANAAAPEGVNGQDDSEDTSAAAAAGGNGDVGDGVYNQHGDLHPPAGAAATVAASGSASCHDKPASWTVRLKSTAGSVMTRDVITGFEISPIPNLLAVLSDQEQSGSTVDLQASSETLDVSTMSDQGLDQCWSGSSISKRRVMYVYDLHSAASAAAAAASAVKVNATLTTSRRSEATADTVDAARSRSSSDLNSSSILPLKLTLLTSSSSSSSSIGSSTSSSSDDVTADVGKSNELDSGLQSTDEAVSSISRVSPPYQAHRYTLGSGQFHGGMVLELHATAAAAAAAAARGDVGVCILQVVPWYVRLWLHTLQLKIDDQVSPLSHHLLLRHISTAQDRAKPLVLNLCLWVPASARTISLSAKFSKSFLTAFEHPPDAHRGFDVPAAQITYLGPVITPMPDNFIPDGIRVDAGWQTEGLRAGGAGAGLKTTGGWQVFAKSGRAGVRGIHNADDGVEKGPGISAAELQTPLMASLAERRPQQVYSPGLVVQLAVPDFSMPYNVICLTSTVLAVFFGSTLNQLLSRPGEEQRLLAGGTYASRAAKRKRKLKLLLLVVTFGALAFNFDPTVQETVLGQLRGLGLLSEIGPEGHVPAAHRDPLHSVT